MATVGSIIRRPVPAGTAVASGLIGLLMGAVLAVGVTAGLVSAPRTVNHQSPVAAVAISNELISHDRSEQALGNASASGEQVAHNRAEEGLGGQ